MIANIEITLFVEKPADEDAARAATPENTKTRKRTIEADVYGDWGAHGATTWSMGDGPPSSSDFVVTHVPSGLTIAGLTGALSKLCAVTLARELAKLEPAPTVQAAYRIRHAIARVVDDVLDAHNELRWPAAASLSTYAIEAGATIKVTL